MTIITNISSNNRFTIIMITKSSPQTKSRVKIPSMITRTKSTSQINLLPITNIIHSLPNTCFLEIHKNTSKKSILSLLFQMNTTRPITNV
ncbi:hypothetical protein MtrunA17_Chr7g0269321 [Medicago truncatula]|uniref:Uncharacterized protein n=1 Tax=Medicago truncatula TaxID=3880 RepID=A0A396H879_MEDTR|nr:hypothetical protein MtrunA17_Chr7g0269321 [Medicago truncatula]